jgi:tetratricopeptide (TPR) repeat protein
MSSFPHIVGFYSFKGGVGRTLALANVAYLMASRGRNVLLIDMDLEAPGLGIFLQTLEELGEPAPADIIDLLAWANAIATDSEPVEGIPSVQMAFPPIQDFTTPIKPERIVGGNLNPQLGLPGRIDVIAVDRDRSYHERLGGLRLASASGEHLQKLGVILRKFFKTARISNPVPEYYGLGQFDQIPYDYVLIDSRTGITEVGGLCFGPLTDRLVVLTGLNHQNIDSTARFLHDVGIDHPRTPDTPPWDDADTLISPSLNNVVMRLGPKPTIVVASLVPSGEIAYKRERLVALSHAIGIPVNCRIYYHPHIALTEAIFARDYPEEFLAIQYQFLCDQILYYVADHPVELLFRARLHINFTVTDVTRWRPAVEWAIRLTNQSPDLALPLLQDLAKFTPLTDEDYRAADRMFRILTQINAPKREVGYRLWGHCLSRWSQVGHDIKPSDKRTEEHFTNKRLSEVRYHQALAMFDAGLALPGLLPTASSFLLFNRGAEKEQHDDFRGAYEDYTKVIEITDTPQELRLRALLGRGLCLGKAGDNTAAIRELTSVTEMPSASADLKGQALWNRGVIHSRAGNVQQAIEDYTTVIEIPGISEEYRGRAIISRASEYKDRKEFAAALSAFTSVISNSTFTLEQRSHSLAGRALTNNALGNFFEASVDQHASELLAVNPEELTRTEQTFPSFRSGSRIIATEPAEMKAYDLVLGLNGLPPVVRSVAFYNRGWNRYLEGRFQEADEDFSAVIDLENQIPFLKASALLNRAATRSALSDKEKALNDLEAVLAIPGLNSETRARALLNLGAEKAISHELQESAEFYKKVLETEDVSSHIRAGALGGLGWYAYLHDDWKECARLSRESLLLEPSNPLHRANMSFAFLHLGEVENAEMEYQRALSDVQTEEDLDRIMKDVENLLAQPTHKKAAERMLALLQARREELTVK